MNINRRDEDNSETGVGCEPTGTSQKLGYLGGNKGGADCDVFETVGMVEAWVKKR